VILADAHGKILLANERVVAKFGYDRAELPGLLVETLVPESLRSDHGVHRTDFQAKPTTRAIGTGHELLARRKDGSEFPVEIGLNQVESAEGLLVLVVIVDISARRQAESETRRLRDELAHVARVTTLSELSGSLAHELNQPLAIILSNAQAAQRLLARDPPDLPEVRTGGPAR
jgi:two-component system, LuxR family, sensor kinase FixL